MDNSHIFEEEVDEEAAAEKAKIESNYSQPQYMPRADKTNTFGLGIASMVMGIISLVIFCSCCNVVLAVLAVIFGFVQIFTKKNKRGTVFAWVGVGTGLAAIICTIIFWALLFSNGSYYTRIYKYNSNPEDMIKEYNEFFEDFYNNNNNINRDNTL